MVGGRKTFFRWKYSRKDTQLIATPFTYLIFELTKFRQ